MFISTVHRRLLILSAHNSDTSVKRLRKSWGLKGTRQQKHTFDTLAPFIQEIRARFPSMGARSMVSTLRLDYGVKAAE